MAISNRENHLRTIAMTNPEWIPCSVVISAASQLQYGSEMLDVMQRHPTLFPGFNRQQSAAQLQRLREAGDEDATTEDSWGCVFRTEVAGLAGAIIHSPLEDWEALAAYRPPDPDALDDRGPANWEARADNARRAREDGGFVRGAMPHGVLFLRLWYLRGFSNFMVDLAAGEPRLRDLIEIVQGVNREKVRRWLSLDLDLLYFGDDMGTQDAPIISPATFREWLAPHYAEMFGMCREAGTYTYLHSDGYVLDLIDDWIKCGVDVLNIQDLAHGIDNLSKHVKGRACLSLDVDRQSIVPYGSPREIRDLIEEEVRKLGSARGGLSLIFGAYPPTPPENVDAVCSAMEELRTFWWD